MAPTALSWRHLELCTATARAGPQQALGTEPMRYVLESLFLLFTLGRLYRVGWDTRHDDGDDDDDDLVGAVAAMRRAMPPAPQLTTGGCSGSDEAGHDLCTTADNWQCSSHHNTAA